MHEDKQAPGQAPVADTKPHQRGALDRDLYCPRLQRLLLGAALEHGHRGNLAQVVASIERGGVGGGGEDPNLGMLRRLGATDTRGVDNRIGQLRELEQEWRSLSPHMQADALVHYLGTPRAHHTIRSIFGEGQGGLAGLVLHMWEIKKYRERARGADGEAKAALERVRAELAPLERAAIEARAVLAAPIVLPPHDGPRPQPPEVPPLRSDENPDGISKNARARLLKPYNEALRAWRAPVRKVFLAIRTQRREAIATLDATEPLLPPLQAEQARLCAQLAAIAAAGSAADDEQALVDLCRSGRLTEESKTRMLNAAAARARALHRAWYAARKRSVKAWADDQGSAA